MLSKNPRRDLNCAARGCPKRRRIQQLARSQYCISHAARAYRYGDAMQTAIPLKLYEPDREFIREGLARYRNSKPVESALKLADAILNYTPDYQWMWKRDLERRMAILRSAGVTPNDLLQRVAEHYACVERMPHLFKSQRGQHVALARHVLKMKRPGCRDTTARLRFSLGSLLAEDLGAFAIQLLRRLQQDLEERHSLRRQAADFDGVMSHE
jgi:hypothetical protein